MCIRDSFASRTRIAIAGSPQDPTINPDPDGDGTPMPIVTFTDPVTHFEYRSAQRDGENASVGWRMLDDARTFAEGEWTDAQQALETAQAAGTPDEVRAAEIAVDRANATLNEKVQMIDFMVNIGNVFSSAG